MSVTAVTLHTSLLASFGLPPLVFGVLVTKSPTLQVNQETVEASGASDFFFSSSLSTLRLESATLSAILISPSIATLEADERCLALREAFFFSLDSFLVSLSICDFNLLIYIKIPGSGLIGRRLNIKTRKEYAIYHSRLVVDIQVLHDQESMDNSKPALHLILFFLHFEFFLASKYP